MIVGFTSVCKCNVPLEPFKSKDRIAVIAIKGEPQDWAVKPRLKQLANQ